MASGFPILTFHAVDERDSIISFPPGVFERGMRGLYESGYRTLNFPELIGYLQRQDPFPERSFLITFDDGYQSVYEHAFPILQRYGFSATVFLTVGEKKSAIDPERLPPLCDRTMLSWGEIREMHQWGVSFGAHTLTHPDLTRLPLSCMEAEIVTSKLRIEHALGSQVFSFAYPFGRSDDRSRQVASSHFACACSDRLGLVTGSSDPFAVERVDAYYLRTDRLFSLMVTKAFSPYIWARAIPRQLRRAVQSYTVRREVHHSG